MYLQLPLNKDKTKCLLLNKHLQPLSILFYHLNFEISAKPFKHLTNKYQYQKELSIELFLSVLNNSVGF